MTCEATEPEEHGLNPDSNRILHEEIDRLPWRFRSALVLCYLEGLTHEKAAEKLGCPVGTIRSRLATARARLRTRLLRRGIAPALLPAGLSGAELASTLESAAEAISVPAALVDATLRGALRVGLTKISVAGTVSLEAALLTEKVLRNMAATKLTLLGTSFVIAGLVTTGAGVAAYSALELKATQPGSTKVAVAASQEPKTSAPTSAKPAGQSLGLSPAGKEQLRRRSEETIRTLLKEYNSETAAGRTAIAGAKNAEQQKGMLARPRPNPASYAGALLYEAEAEPATPAAEEALIWVATNLTYGSMAERAKELIARDHIASPNIEPLFGPIQISMTGSRATEHLFREALAKNPDRKIRGLACYSLARFLEEMASVVRLDKLFDPAEREQMRMPVKEAGWGRDYGDRLLKLDADFLEREAGMLYERVVTEFGDLPLPHPFPRLTGDLLLPSRPTTYGAAAKVYLHALRDLGIGRAAPEIEGLDLDGKPMKLSDYRGRVAVIYFCGPNQLRAAATRQPPAVSKAATAVAKRHKGDPFALLGVTTVGIERTPDRQTFKASLDASGMPARFWWDIAADGKPGPIQAAWNARVDFYVIDHRGVIRYRHVLGPSLLEKTVATLLQEQRAANQDKPNSVVLPKGSM